MFKITANFDESNTVDIEKYDTVEVVDKLLIRLISRSLPKMLSLNPGNFFNRTKLGTFAVCDYLPEMGDFSRVMITSRI